MLRAAPLLSVLLWGGCGNELPPAPVQPVAFSHKVHVGDNGIGCTTCHAYVERSSVAGMPSMQRCHGCHKFIGKDKPSIQVVNKAFDDEKPIAWSRVYRLPDHVYFTHERHIVAGLRCQECHGDVEKMEVVRQASNLTMGWCVDCHQQRRASLDCLTCHK